MANIGDLTATLKIDGTSATKSVTTISDQIIALNQHMKMLQDRMQQGFDKGAANAFHDYAQAVKDTKNRIIELENAQEGLNMGWRSMATQLKDISYTLRILRSGIASVMALGGGLMVFTEAWKTYKSIMDSTNLSADKFEQTQMTLSFQLDVVKRAIATGNWKDFTKNLDEAAESANKLTDAMQAQFALGLQTDVLNSKLKTQMVLQMEIYRNTKNSDDIRNAAIQKYLALNQQVLENQMKLDKEQEKVALNSSSVQASGLNKDQIQWFVEHAFAIENDSKAIQAYLEAQQSVQNELAKPLKSVTISEMGIDQTLILGRNQQIIDDSRKKMISILSTLDPIGREAIGKFMSWMKITDEDKKKIVDSWVKLQSDIQAAEQKIIRAERSANGIKDNPSKLFLDELATKYQNMTQEISNNPVKFTDIVEGMDDHFAALNKMMMMDDEAKDSVSALNRQLAQEAYLQSVLGSRTVTSNMIIQETVSKLNNLRAAFLQTYAQQQKIQGVNGTPKFTPEMTNDAKQIAHLEHIKTLQEAYKKLGDQIQHSLQNGSQSWNAYGKSVISVTRQLITAGIADAMVSAIETAMKAAGSLGPFGLVAIPALVGIAMGAVNTAVSQIPGMAEGGVVPSGFPGDTYPAMLTSGEVVTPPGKLDGIQNISNQQFHVDFRINGYELYGQLKKYDNKLGKI
jgi:hypothetical protein